MADKKKQRDKKKTTAKKSRQLVAVQSEKYFDIPGKMTAVSLELPRDLQYDDWASIGSRLTRLREFTNFAIGDWLCFGENKYGETYSQAATETGIPEDRLVILKYVSMHVAPERRIDRPNFWSHHREVASLDPKEQTRWLEKSAKDGWTVKQLKEAIGKKGRRKETARGDNGSGGGMCPICGEEEATVPVGAKCLGMISDDKEKALSKPQKNLLAWAFEFIQEPDKFDDDGARRQWQKQFDKARRAVGEKSDA